MRALRLKDTGGHQKDTKLILERERVTCLFPSCEQKYFDCFVLLHLEWDISLNKVIVLVYPIFSFRISDLMMENENNFS